VEGESTYMNVCTNVMRASNADAVDRCPERPLAVILGEKGPGRTRLRLCAYPAPKPTCDAVQFA
jgi:hypothetical protein